MKNPSKMKDGSRNAKILSTCPHNKGTKGVCPFVVWTGAKYLGIPLTILHFTK